MSKSIIQRLLFTKMWEQMNGFKYSRHRSARILKKLRKRHSPKALIWLDELGDINRDTLAELRNTTGIASPYFPDALDAMRFAFDRTPTEQKIITESSPCES